MPFIEAGGLRHYYRLEGTDDHPVLMLSHSLGCDHSMWDPQVPDLLPHFRVLRYDTCGHGASDLPSADCTIELLARDALAIAGGLGIKRFAFCGLSMGGMIGQWLGAHAADRVTRLVLSNTSSRLPDPGPMEARRRTVLEQGMAAVEPTVMGRFFLPESLAADPPAVATTRRTLLATNPAGYAACCAAVRDLNQVADLKAIRAPVLITAGSRDQSTPWEGHGEVLAREIPHARVERFPTAHLSNLERPRSYTAALLRFLMDPPADTLAAGMATRRARLGDALVDRKVAATTDFTRDFQELITRYAWGTIWQRPGLDPRTRRLLVLATTASLGRWEEFRLHVRAGLDHELEPCDIQEALLQTAIYAGVPAANTGFQIASEELARSSS